MLRFGKKSTSSVPAVPFEVCPAKTFESLSGVSPGRSVLNHCQIVGEVAREIVRRQPAALSSALYPEGAHLAAAAHDIGKVSPTFVEKLRRACTPGLCDFPSLAGVNPQLESAWGGHAGVSQLTAKALGVPEFVPEVLGQHHGFSPALAGLRAQDDQFGGSAWQEERVRLVDALASALQSSWPIITGVAQARLVAGLTSVADWIGSGQYFEDPQQPWEENICKALDAAGFVPPQYRSGMSFSEIFGFAPRSAQTALIDQVQSPGVYVMEAPMGLGMNRPGFCGGSII